MVFIGFCIFHGVEQCAGLLQNIQGVSSVILAFFFFPFRKTDLQSLLQDAPFCLGFVKIMRFSLSFCFFQSILKDSLFEWMLLLLFVPFLWFAQNNKQEHLFLNKCSYRHRINVWQVLPASHGNNAPDSLLGGLSISSLFKPLWPHCLYPQSQIAQLLISGPAALCFSYTTQVQRQIWEGDVRCIPFFAFDKICRGAAICLFLLQRLFYEVPIMKNKIRFKPTETLQIQNMLKGESQTEPLQRRDHKREAMKQRCQFCRRVRLYVEAGEDSNYIKKSIIGSSL